MLKDTDHNGFPIAVSEGVRQFLVGYVPRRDLSLAVGKPCYRFDSTTCDIYYFLPVNAKRTQEELREDSLRLIHTLAFLEVEAYFGSCLDYVTHHTPMETVIDLYRKLGVRQVLVTHNGLVALVKF